jgi:hypothetical protein
VSQNLSTSFRATHSKRSPTTLDEGPPPASQEARHTTSICPRSGCRECLRSDPREPLNALRQHPPRSPRQPARHGRPAPCRLRL